MFLVMPSDPTTIKASEYLQTQGIEHMVLDIPEELGYRTTAKIGLYVPGQEQERLMLDLSAQGFVIMRVFKSFELC